MGFGFPKEEREALVASDPRKFLMPEPSDLRYHWVQVRLAAIDATEMRELVLDAWRMCVPKRVAADYERTIATIANEPPGVTTSAQTSMRVAHSSGTRQKGWPAGSARTR